MNKGPLLDSYLTVAAPNRLSHERYGFFFTPLDLHYINEGDSEEIIRILKMNNLVLQAISASKNSRKNNRLNYEKIKRQFWQLVTQIRREVTLTPEEEERLAFHMNKMK